MVRFLRFTPIDFAVWNNRFAGVLMTLAVLAALPFASNRPLWWLIWTVAIAGLACLYQLLAWRCRTKAAARARPFAGLFALAALVPAFALVQASDLRGLLPDFAPKMPADLHDLAGGSLSVVPEASQIGALRFCGYLLFLALVIEVSTRRGRVEWMSWILFFGITLQAIWALVALNLLGDVTLFAKKTAYLGMATGSFVNRNALACFLGFGLILGAALLGTRALPGQQATRGLRAVFMQFRGGGAVIAVGMLLQALALVATQSRLGLLATIVGLTMAVLLRLRLRGWRHGFWPLLALGVALIFGLLWGQGVAERLLLTQSDGATRLALYRQILTMIQMRPLTGFGFDGFAPAFEAFRAPPLNLAVSYGHGHNTYLTLWAELGVLVGSLPPLLCLAAGVICLRRLRQGDGFSANAVAAIGALVLAGLQSAADFSLEIPANTYVFLAMLGMGAAQRSSGTRAQPLA